MRQVIPTSIIRWFTVWTVVGALFSLQLRWHYDLPWSLSLFWGFADWYLWSLLALVIFIGVRLLKKINWNFRNRVLLYVGSAPVVAGIHVLLTMVVGGTNDLPAGLTLTGYFAALYAKKIMLNLLTFGVLATIGEQLTYKPQIHATNLLGKLGDVTRIIAPEEIIWGEVCGNYMNLHTKHGIWPVRLTLVQLMRHLPEQQFVRISRSRVINLDQVQAVTSTAGRLSVTLSNETEHQVARRLTAAVRKAIRSCTG